MVFGNGFFTYSENDALEEMTKLAGCSVERCVYPTASKITYFLSEKGDCYSAQRVQGRYLVRTKQADRGSHSKRKNGGLIMRLKSTPRKEVGFHLEWLMYCTFVLKRWEEPQREIVFLDGNAKNVRPNNLILPKQRIPPEWAEQMSMLSGLYEAEFETVTSMVAAWSGLPREDAQDVVQDVFICHSTKRFVPDLSRRLWLFLSKKRALTYLVNRYRRFEHDGFVEDAFEGGTDTHYEIDLCRCQPGKKGAYELYLWSHGCTTTEIAEVMGSKIGTVGSVITRRIQYLKQYLKNEEKLLR